MRNEKQLYVQSRNLKKTVKSHLKIYCMYFAYKNQVSETLTDNVAANRSHIPSQGLGTFQAALNASVAMITMQLDLSLCCL